MSVSHASSMRRPSIQPETSTPSPPPLPDVDSSAADVRRRRRGRPKLCAECARRSHLFDVHRSAIVDKMRISSPIVRNFLAELLGTFVVIIFGCGSVAQTVLSRGQSGGQLSINLSWGWAVSMAVWTAGGISCAHLNPSISLTMVVMEKLPLRQLLVYWFAQYLGAFIGAACLYGIYYDALNHFDGGVRSVIGPNATAGIWATYPQPYLSTRGGFADQVFGTFMLVLCVLAINDHDNVGAPSGLAPLAVGGLVGVIGMSLGLNCGYAINPARDLGPRIFTAVAGWGTEVFTAYNNWWWVPVAGPHVGALCGAFAYQLFISMHLPADTDDDPSQDGVRTAATDVEKTVQ